MVTDGLQKVKAIIEEEKKKTFPTGNEKKLVANTKDVSRWPYCDSLNVHTATI